MLKKMRKPPYIKEQSRGYTTSSFCDGKYVLTEEEIAAHRFFIDKKDDWFWSDEWQEGEKRVEQYIKNGNYEVFNSIEEFVSSLSD